MKNTLTSKDVETLKRLIEYYESIQMGVINENPEYLKCHLAHKRLPSPETEDQYYWYKIGQWDAFANSIDSLACMIEHLKEE